MTKEDSLNFGIFLICLGIFLAALAVISFVLVIAYDNPIPVLLINRFSINGYILQALLFIIGILFIASGSQLVKDNQ